MNKIILLTAVFFCFSKIINAQDGEPDQSFGTGGIVKTRFSDTTAYNGTAVQADGKIVAAGYTWNGKNYDFLVVRYNQDGSLDSTFSGDGKHKTDFEASNDYGLAVAIQKDGKIVVAGSSNHRFALARYNTDGSLDKTFSGDGRQIDNFHGSSDEAKSVVIQSDGKIVVAGVAKNSFAVARYTATGSLDNSFSGDGIQTANFTEPFGFNESANAAVIQNDGKIVVVGKAEDQFAIARYNSDGSPDTSFSNDGKVTTKAGAVFSSAKSAAMQKDGKIVVAGEIAAEESNGGFALLRYNTNGSPDSTFHSWKYYNFKFINSIAIQGDDKIVGGGSSQDQDDEDENFTLFRFDKNGNTDSSFSDNGVQITPVKGINFNGVKSIAVANNKLYAAGTSVDSDYYGVIAAYHPDNSNKAPTVSISVPNNTLVYTAPAKIKLNATASDENGTIKKVEFYEGNKLLHTENVFPYGYLWKNVPEGDYTLTAKAYDNDGFSKTSDAIHISVVYNQSPVVKIISPPYDTVYTAPDSIRIVAEANDPDGYLTKVKFFAENVETRKDSLLRIEYHYPYICTWKNVQAGSYYITIEAEDNKGYTTRSHTYVTVDHAGGFTMSRKSYSRTEKTPLNDALRLKLSPNPAGNIINIYTNGLQQNKPATISIISVSGIVLKNIQINKTATQLDVSSLASGVYTVKIVSGNKALYKQFVKL